MLFLFKIGFLSITFWDILDIAIVGYLIYIVYKTLKGSIAFNIFVGVATLFLIYWLLTLLRMDMLSEIMNQLASVSVITLIVIFQPEIRRFLIHLGNSTLRSRTNFIGRWLAQNLDIDDSHPTDYQQVKSALLQMSKEKTGALIVVGNNVDLETISDTGVELDAKISHSLLLSIFNKKSPLHDGAVVITNGKILAAGCVLPLSDSQTLPASSGLRHRAALGLAERTNACSFIVSEETGAISFTREANIEFALSEDELEERVENLIKDR